MAYNTHNTKGYKQLAGYSTIPAPGTDHLGPRAQTPTYVICTKVATYSFSYPDGTASGGSSSFIQGAKVTADEGPVKLDINPVKWTSDTAPAAGDVIFVYRRMG